MEGRSYILWFLPFYVHIDSMLDWVCEVISDEQRCLYVSNCCLLCPTLFQSSIGNMDDKISKF